MLDLLELLDLLDFVLVSYIAPYTSFLDDLLLLEEDVGLCERDGAAETLGDSEGA